MQFHFFQTFIIYFVMVLVLRQDALAAESKMGPMQIASSSFKNNDYIASEYSCDGDDISPPLEWTQVPEKTQSFALIADDPDAPMGTWVHWVIYNIPAESRSLGKDVPHDSMLENGSVQGSNDFRLIGYNGPCPPSGKVHRYFFKLYALDVLLEVYPGAPKKDVLSAMEGHVLAEAQIIGLYKR
ncbi:MAG: YbhB/YbcL family Raf kinase inhibitor-like protein [Chlamydiota bacterium]|nr:YbhB/YbcL family Raf kinase inhibitor-like protein [Chlamydiota bacterium]